MCAKWSGYVRSKVRSTFWTSLVRTFLVAPFLTVAFLSLIHDILFFFPTDQPSLPGSIVDGELYLEPWVSGYFLPIYVT